MTVVIREYVPHAWIMYGSCKDPFPTSLPCLPQYWIAKERQINIYDSILSNNKTNDTLDITFRNNGGCFLRAIFASTSQ